MEKLKRFKLIIKASSSVPLATIAIIAYISDSYIGYKIFFGRNKRFTEIFTLSPWKRQSVVRFERSSDRRAASVTRLDVPHDLDLNLFQGLLPRRLLLRARKRLGLLNPEILK